MTIIELVKLIADDLTTDLSFKHGREAWQNIQADAEQPDEVVLYLDEPITSNDVLNQNNQLSSTYSLSMVFAKQSELEDNPLNYAPIIEQMRTLSASFLRKLAKKTDSTGELYVQNIENIQRLDVYNSFDANLSGVVLECRVTLLPSSEIC